MAEQGFASHWPMHKLSVNGYVEVLGQLREILAIRRELKQNLLADPPMAFIGVDAPDFNFNVEIAMRRAGVPVVHFVSPSIWAWRAGRIKTIARAVDHILCLFPFEPEIYARAGIPATYVGHPLADEIPLEPDVEGARSRLGLPLGRKVVAVLPGSRNSEVKLLGPTLFAAMARMQAVEPDLAFVLPAANAMLRERIDAMRAEHPGLHLWVVDGQSHAAMEAADVILLASGTATLEAALYKKPMVITYKVPWLTAQIMKRKGHLPYVGLPNILSGRFVVPELLQDDATPEALARETLLQLSDHANAAFLREHFTQMHLTLKQNMADIGAQVVVDLLRGAANSETMTADSTEIPQLALPLSQSPAAGKRARRILCGVDEAGRGPLAGPVTAAAVVLNPRKPIQGLADSKVLTAKKREALYDEIVEKALAWHVAEATVEEIDRINILHATMLAMQRAVQGVAAQGVLPDLVQVDGNRCPQVAFAVEAIVKGDALVPAISAASILAKVTRDRQLAALHIAFPQYGFDVHAGYGTPQHLAAIERHGVTPHHRRSFAPVRRALDGAPPPAGDAVPQTDAKTAWAD